MAATLGIQNWDLEPNSDAAGGRVIIVEGDLAGNPELLRIWCDQAQALGNSPVDMLACVPPLLVDHQRQDQLCRPAAEYEADGGVVWDGTSRDIREQYPTHRDQLRFVQYDSCRGLEGWTVFNYLLEELWEYKRSQWFLEDHPVDDLYESADEAAELHASRWVMIPLTRAIDTLVINVGTRPSSLKSALLKVASQRGDFVEWIDLTQEAVA
jgi:hypothetical protein